MTRDELILSALVTGDRSTADLAQTTGLSERVCRYGVAHLIGVGYVWSPARGRWRLTEAGRVIAATLSSPPADGELAPESTPLLDDERAPVAEQPTTVASAHQPGPPASVWWTVAGIIVAVALAIARRSGPTPPPPSPPAPPTIEPYGWRI